MACNVLIEKLVFVQDLHWRKPNEHQKNSSEAYHLEKQLKLQLNNALLVYSDFLQRNDFQIDEIFILCKKTYERTHVHNWMTKE
jgi:hypothetical protein